jgi:hypothetical protein
VTWPSSSDSWSAPPPDPQLPLHGGSAHHCGPAVRGGLWSGVMVARAGTALDSWWWSRAGSRRGRWCGAARRAGRRCPGRWPRRRPNGAGGGTCSVKVVRHHRRSGSVCRPVARLGNSQLGRPRSRRNLTANRLTETLGQPGTTTRLSMKLYNWNGVPSSRMKTPPALRRQDRHRCPSRRPRCRPGTAGRLRPTAGTRSAPVDIRCRSVGRGGDCDGRTSEAEGGDRGCNSARDCHGNAFLSASPCVSIESELERGHTPRSERERSGSLAVVGPSRPPSNAHPHRRC